RAPPIGSMSPVTIKAVLLIPRMPPIPRRASLGDLAAVSTTVAPPPVAWADIRARPVTHPVNMAIADPVVAPSPARQIAPDVDAGAHGRFASPRTGGPARVALQRQDDPMATLAGAPEHCPLRQLIGPGDVD